MMPISSTTEGAWAARPRAQAAELVPVLIRKTEKSKQTLCNYSTWWMPAGLFASCTDANSLTEQTLPLCNKTIQVIKKHLAGLQTRTLSINCFSGGSRNGYWRFCFIPEEIDLTVSWIRAEPVRNHIQFNIILFSATKYSLWHTAFLKISNEIRATLHCVFVLYKCFRDFI